MPSESTTKTKLSIGSDLYEIQNAERVVTTDYLGVLKLDNAEKIAENNYEEEIASVSDTIPSTGSGLLETKSNKVVSNSNKPDPVGGVKALVSELGSFQDEISKIKKSMRVSKEEVDAAFHDAERAEVETDKFRKDLLKIDGSIVGSKMSFVTYVESLQKELQDSIHFVDTYLKTRSTVSGSGRV